MLCGNSTGKRSSLCCLLSGMLEAEAFIRTSIVAALSPECTLKHQGCCSFAAQKSGAFFQSLIIRCISPSMPA